MYSIIMYNSVQVPAAGVYTEWNTNHPKPTFTGVYNCTHQELSVPVYTRTQAVLSRLWRWLECDLITVSQGIPEYLLPPTYTFS